MPAQHKYDFSVLLGTCVKLACQALGDLQPTQAPGYDFCPHSYQLPSYPTGRCPDGCFSTAFNRCPHHAVLNSCTSPGCGHATTCACGYAWGSGRGGRGGRGHNGHNCQRPATQTPAADVTPAAFQHLLPWLRLSGELQLDALSAACLARLKSSTRQQLAGVLEDHMGELLGLGEEHRGEVGKLLAAALRS